MSRRAARFAVSLVAVILAACSSFGEDGVGPNAPPPGPSAPPPGGDAGLEEADAAAPDASAAYASAVLADGPVAYWRLGEKAGTSVARDETGKHDAQYDGCMLGAPGIVAGDTAASFAADASSIVLPIGLDFAGTAPFTIEAWINPAASQQVFRHAFTQIWFDTKGRQGFLLLIDSGMYAFERSVDGSNESRVVAPVAARTGAFSHVVATYDGATMRLYVDGSTMGTSPDRRALPATDAPMYISASGTHQQVIKGVMDEVAVYDKALPEARVKAHFAAAPPR
jgi:hypothetical protein